MAHYSKVIIGGGNGSYRVYTAQLRQTGATAPVAIVLENTLGYAPTWSRTSAGLYTLNAIEFLAENSNKVVIFFNDGVIPDIGSSVGNFTYTKALWSMVNNEVVLLTGYMGYCFGGPGCTYDFSFIQSDDKLGSFISGTDFKASFELRIYN